MNHARLKALTIELPRLLERMGFRKRTNVVLLVEVDGDVQIASAVGGVEDVHRILAKTVLTLGEPTSIKYEDAPAAPWSDSGGGKAS